MYIYFNSGVRECSGIRWHRANLCQRGLLCPECLLTSFDVAFAVNSSSLPTRRMIHARRVYNAMIDKRPSLIVMCVDVADVIAAVNFARDNEMLVAIRGGGHNGGGLGYCDDGLVIDLSRMKGVRVDPWRTRCASAEAAPGATWITPRTPSAWPCRAASSPPPASAGLTLGGGIGHLTRKYGLTIDNLLSVDVVLADGRFVTASSDQQRGSLSGPCAAAAATSAS